MPRVEQNAGRGVEEGMKIISVLIGLVLGFWLRQRMLLWGAVTPTVVYEELRKRRLRCFQDRFQEGKHLYFVSRETTEQGLCEATLIHEHYGWTVQQTGRKFSSLRAAIRYLAKKLHEDYPKMGWHPSVEARDDFIKKWNAERVAKGEKPVVWEK